MVFRGTATLRNCLGEFSLDLFYEDLDDLKVSLLGGLTDQVQTLVGFKIFVDDRSVLVFEDSIYRVYVNSETTSLLVFRGDCDILDVVQHMDEYTRFPIS